MMHFRWTPKSIGSSPMQVAGALRGIADSPLDVDLRSRTFSYSRKIANPKAEFLAGAERLPALWLFRGVIESRHGVAPGNTGSRRQNISGQRRPACRCGKWAAIQRRKASCFAG